MASSGLDINWIELLKWGVPIVFYAGATWAAYKQLVKKQDSDSKRIDQLERRVAGGVRRQDIEALNQRIDTLSQTTDQKLDLILQVVKAAK